MKKNLIPTIFALAAALLFSISCKKDNPAEKEREEEKKEETRIAVESIRLDKEAISLEIDEEVSLNATVLPEDATDREVSWTSGDPLVASVSESGKVVALKEGSCTVTATAEGGSKSAVCVVTVKAKPKESLLEGRFSVSQEKKVQFSKGNLFFDGSSFHFEENQYDIPSNWSAAHAGYFFWSVSTGVATADTYSESSAMAPTDVFFTNATADTPDPEFSVDGETGVFRTLSASEWQYLFKTRTSASDLYAKGVTVCGKTNCIVLAPDDYKGKIAASYDSGAWKKAEEEECLVCLPASGYRDGTNVVNAGTGGYYWASTASYGSISSNVTFDGSFVTPSSFAMRSIGYPIRLVKE